MPNCRTIGSVFVSTLLLATACDLDAPETLEAAHPPPAPDPGSPPATPPAPPPPPLVPPAPYVLDTDGVRQLTLEEAGIYKPDGRRWALVLGKALFWDEQSGSDGNGCASCHFHAGADTRLRNQLSPGFNDVTHAPSGDSGFGSIRSDTGTVARGYMPSGARARPNYRLQPEDLPLHQLLDETDRNSPVITTTNDRVSSLGSFAATFEHTAFLGMPDGCSDADPLIFHAGRYAARQVEPRHTPSFHNSAFNFRNFWDNRANNLFNGVGVFGMRDVLDDPSLPNDPRRNNRLIIIEKGRPTLGYLKVENASTASQAVGPPTSALEMSCGGRTFADVGRRLLSTIPLLRQKVHKRDSVLGPYVSPSGYGLDIRYHYAALIMRAFDPKYWALPGRYRIVDGSLIPDPTGYTQMEINFSMFWGLAIAEFEATQTSDRSEFDELQAAGKLVMAPNFAPGGPAIGRCTATNDVDPLLVRGCTIFARANVGNPNPPSDGIRGGNCFVCHNASGGGLGRTRQPLLSEGSFQQGETIPMFLTVTDVNGRNDLRDNGSANIGLRDVFSDLMSGRTDPYGNPLSFGRQLWNYLDGKPGAILDPPLERLLASGRVPTRLPPTSTTTPGGTFRKLEVDGSTKAPILRNVALTPPYFSWGGYPSLRQVLKVYNRGMNRRDISGAGVLDAHGTGCAGGDDTGTGPDGNQPWPLSGSADCNTNTTGLIVPLGLSDCDANGAPNAACTTLNHTTATDDLAALERFLKSLTDRRVQCDRAPFDHPELTILNGHRDADRNYDGKADDVTFTLPAVGADGYSPSSGFCIPNAGDLFAPGMQSRSGGPRVRLY